MAELAEIVDFLDMELRLNEIPDYSAAHNGLQLENGGKVNKVVSAVDASFPVIEKAVAAGADLLVVHHGLFWQGVRMLRGAAYQKLKLAMDNGLAIYSAHIPLDVHPLLGNNILLAKALDLEVTGTFMDWKGIQLGIKGRFERSLGDLKDRVAEAVQGPVLLRGKCEDLCGVVGIVTGGAGSEVEAVAAQGINTFITGEGPHWSHPLAEELGLNVLYAGHYATETFGVRRLGNELATRFNLSEDFIAHPSGL